MPQWRVAWESIIPYAADVQPVQFVVMSRRLGEVALWAWSRCGRGRDVGVVAPSRRSS